jgi:hypothetical protein
VICPALEVAGADPLVGDQFAVGSGEVLEKVRVYVDALAERARAGDDLAPPAPTAPPAPACPNTTTAAVAFVLEQHGPDTPMGIACTLSLLYGLAIVLRQVRGAALQLARRGRARFLRGKLTLLTTAGGAPA